MRIIFFNLFLLFNGITVVGQNADSYILTKEGSPIINRRQFVFECKRNLGMPAENQLATQVCECRADLIDGRFTMKQLRSYIKTYGNEAMDRLIANDTALQREFNNCSSTMGDIPVSTIPEYRESFIKRCKFNLEVGTLEEANDTLVHKFCSCAADVIETRKIPVDRVEELYDENSFLYNEVVYKCGSPFLKPTDIPKDWKAADSTEIKGRHIDSVPVISVMGMTKIKITMGKSTKIWMLDSGASDMVISEGYFKDLVKAGVMHEKNFVGSGKFQIADGKIITCKRYKADSVQIGSFVVKDVLITVSRGSKTFLVGKSLLNKFSQWTLDNENNLLILKK